MQETKNKRVVIPLRPLFRWLIRLRKSPKAIAGGLALGTFIAFTPTIGVQIWIAIFLATVLNMNRPAALLSIWITNAATMAPIYTFNYLVGTFFWEGPPVGEVYTTFKDLAASLLRLGFLDVAEQLETVMRLSKDVIIPLTIGSFVVGLVAALLVYLLSMVVLRFLLRHRARKHVLQGK